MDELINAPAEAGSEPIAVEPNPISTDNVDHEAQAKAQEKVKAEPKQPDSEKKPSAREAIEKAMQKVEAEEKEPPAKDKAPVKVDDTKPAAERDETGKFKGKATEGQEPSAEAQAQADKQQAADKAQAPVKDEGAAKPSHHEAPSRFSNEAKAEWATAPENVRAETHRAIRELETGIQDHQRRWEPVRQYDELAKKHGTSLPDALERYVAFDMDLNNDLVGGLDRIVRDKTGGEMGLKDIIAQLSGQKPDQQQSQADATIHRLEQKIASLEKQVGGVTGHMESQTRETINQHVASFAADRKDFDALSPQIAVHIGNGMSLDEAYTKAQDDARHLAEQLGFIPKPAETVPDPKPAPSAQTDKGTKSIAGAPSAGSAPASEKPSSSVRDAVRRAMQAAG